MNLLEYCLFYVFLSWPQGLWDLNSPTRDQTHTPCIGRCGLNHWTAREVPSQPFLILCFLIYEMGVCRVPCSDGPCEGEESGYVYSALHTMSSPPVGIINIITVVIISRLSICYNPNSWRTVQGNKSLFLFFPLGIIRFASSRSSEASGRRETSAELIKEPGLQEQAQPD